MHCNYCKSLLPRLWCLWESCQDSIHVQKKQDIAPLPMKTAISNPQEVVRLPCGSQGGLPCTVGTRQKVRSLIC